MIRFTGLADEHGELPENLKVKGEKNTAYITYAWVETNELNENEVLEEFIITVMDYKPARSQRTEFIFSDPIWHFIQEERTEEQQRFIDKNFDKLNELFIEFAKSQGYL